MTKIKREKVPAVDDHDFWTVVFEKIELGATERSIAREYNFSPSTSVSYTHLTLPTKA